MAPNKSVERFRKLTKDLQREIHADAVAQLDIEADGFVAAVESVAPVGPTGELVHSVRKIPGKTDTVVRVVVGNQATIKDNYSYPRADEFGTVKQPAKPFFYPTYRLLKPKMVSRMKRKITASIKKRSAE